MGTDMTTAQKLQPTQTNEEFVNEFLESYVAHFIPISREDGRFNNRLWVHDLIHAVLSENGASSRSEEIVAIYQAVLLKDLSVDVKINEHKCWDDTVTFDDIKNKIIPELHENFLIPLGRRHHFTPLRQLDEKDMKEFFDKATILSKFIESKFEGRSLGDIGVEELLEMDSNLLVSLHEKAIATYNLQHARDTTSTLRTAFKR